MYGYEHGMGPCENSNDKKVCDFFKCSITPARGPANCFVTRLFQNELFKREFDEFRCAQRDSLKSFETTCFQQLVYRAVVNKIDLERSNSAKKKGKVKRSKAKAPKILYNYVMSNNTPTQRWA
eukprot:gb/GEZJ01004153.1/.p4 GENE.gb/GEZJ01004153.1/~~gb/GEZJ01004153.1/.p4  ORF type:complete len:123 (+),score=10.54 gb/GEZJ01004153.1/:848-1216(+)